MISRISRLKITTVLMAGLFLLGACAKDDPEIEDEPDPIPSVPPYFAWQIDGGATKVADSSYAYIQSHVLFAFKNTGEGLEVNLSSMAAGSYSISPATGNSLQYTDGSGSHDAIGSFVISGVASGRMSGHFSCTFSGSSLSTITGTFSEVPRR